MSITGGFMVPHPPLIIPEIGRGEEQKIADTVGAYRCVARGVAELRPDTIVVISPHSIMYADYFHISPGSSAIGDFGQFRAGAVQMEAAYDREFVRGLEHSAKDHGLDVGTLGEKDPKLDHGTMVPLYFINQEYRGYELVRIGLSGFSLRDHYELGRCIREVADELGRNTVIIASGDLSHKLKEDGPYGFAEEGPMYDKAIMEIMGAGNFGSLLNFSEEFLEKSAECGHRSFVIMAGAFDRTSVKPERLSYEGPFGVGYGICMFHPAGPDSGRSYGEQYDRRRAAELGRRKASEDGYVRLARLSLETYIREGTVICPPEGLEPELKNMRAGAFVSLKIDGKLRGCIGTIRPARESLAEEIIWNAVSAGTGDPRFSPVREKELDKLEYSVDVLGEAEPVAALSELDPVRYGVIVTRGGRRGLLLPNLDGVDTVQEQIAIARRKAGIREEDEVKLERFEVVRHE